MENVKFLLDELRALTEIDDRSMPFLMFCNQFWKVEIFSFFNFSHTFLNGDKYERFLVEWRPPTEIQIVT